MEKLKKVFTPGQQHDDEVMYAPHGTPQPDSTHESAYISGRTNSASHDEELIKFEHERQAYLDSLKEGRSGQEQTSSDTAQTSEMSSEGKKEHGVLRQILNPGGEKHSELAYGSGSAEQPGQEKSAFGGQSTSSGIATERSPMIKDDSQTATSIEKEEKGDREESTSTEKKGSILGRIFSRDKSDKGTEDTSATDTTRSATDERTYDSTPSAATGAATGAGAGAVAGGAMDNSRNTAPGTAAQRLKVDELGTDDASTASIKSGVPGPYAGDADRDLAGAMTGTRDTTTTPTASDSYGAAPEVPAKSSERYLGENNTGGDFEQDASKALGLGTVGAGAGAGAAGLASSTGRSGPEAGAADTSSRGVTDSSGSGVANIDSSTYTDRSFALGGAGSSSAGGQTTSTHADPATATGAEGGSKDTSHLGYGDGREALASAAGGAAAGGVGGSTLGKSHDHLGHGHQYGGPSTGQPSEGYAHHAQGPHVTDTANRLDPHVPGEFPSEDGTDKHGHSRLGEGAAAGTATGATGAAAASAMGSSSQAGTRDYPTTSSSGLQSSQAAGGDPSAEQAAYDAARDGNSGTKGYDTGNQFSSASQTASTAQGTESSERHNYGRDAAIGGGAGAAGIAAATAYGRSQDRSAAGAAQPDATQRYQQSQPSVTTGTTTTTTTTTSTGPGSRAADTSRATDTSRAADTSGAADYRQPTEKDHHYGRDAALVGAGAGAAGAGAYAYDKSRDDTGPASKTIGPHDSNVANVADPRVQPEPEKMRGERTTAGPHSSDIANKADPRVTSDPQKAAEKEEHHYGRDAAIGAGAAGAGGAAYAAYDDSQEKKLEKAREKEAEKAEKAHQKEVEKAEKQQRKDSEKAEKQHQKEVEKAEKQHQKEAERRKSSEDKERKPSLVQRLLHRKDDKEQEQEQDRKGEMAAAGAAGTAGVAGATAAERNATHEPQTTQREAQSVPHTEASRGGSVGSQRVGIDGPIGQSKNVSDLPPEDHIVIEPHTGLPMNVGKYGYGAGGTDGARNIEGYNEAAETGGERRASSIGTAELTEKGRQPSGDPSEAIGPDWEKIRKANTPY